MHEFATAEDPVTGAIPPAMATVSVVIPCFNSADTIADAVGSSLREKSVREVIVADDGSMDNSVEIARGLGSSVIISQDENKGASTARNRGLSLATSDYVLFLDADDCVEIGFIDHLATGADQADVVLGAHRHIDVDGHTIRIVAYDAELPANDLLAEYLHRPIQTGAFLWRRAWLEASSGWDESLPIFQDADFAIRMLLRGPTAIIAKAADVHALWRENTRPQRITNSFGTAKAEGTLRSLNGAKTAVVATGNSRAIEGLALRYYALARRCMGSGHYNIGTMALQAARDLGLTGHVGSKSHRIISRIIGLKAKTRIIRAMSSNRPQPR
jgi:hypothetical protein